MPRVMLAAECATFGHQSPKSFSLKFLFSSKVLKMAFTGHADCAEVNWTLFGLSMPYWTAISYALIGAGAVWAAFRRRQPKR